MGIETRGASLFTMSDAEVRARIEDAFGRYHPAHPESNQKILALMVVYQNELNRRLLEKILKTQTDDE